MDHAHWLATGAAKGSWDEPVPLDVENIRITYVRVVDRDSIAEWAGTDVFRIQALEAGTRALHMGAELMLRANRPEAMLTVIEALCKLWVASHAAVAMGEAGYRE